MDFTIKKGVLEKYKGKDKTVVIPDGIAKIGGYAFYCCGSLQEVVIPDSVKKIGKEAFSYCKSLEKIVIPDSVTTIGDEAFRCCESLQDDKGFVIVNNILFDYYDKDEIIKIPDSVTEIGYRAFDECESLKEVVIPNSVTEIGEEVFSWCTSLKEVVIPDSVNQIGARAFYKCNSLELVTFPDDIEFKLKKKYNEYQFENISDDLNKYINQFTKVFLYLDNDNNYGYLNYKTDIPSIINFNIRGYEDIEISDEERNIMVNQLKEKCNGDENYYIPLAVFADDDTVNELIDIINVWAKGKKKDKERLMRVKGALLLNDTMAAQKYFEKIDKLDLYAKKRGLDVNDLRNQVLSDFGLDEN